MVLFALSRPQAKGLGEKVFFSRKNKRFRLPGWLSGKESTCPCRRHRFDPWVGKIPWRRKWQPTPVFLPGESHGQGKLVGYSSWGSKELDMTEHTHTFLRGTGMRA